MEKRLKITMLEESIKLIWNLSDSLLQLFFLIIFFFVCIALEMDI